MDAGLLKTCHREIGHIVLDAKEKITARRISNNWDIDFQKSMGVLQQWIDEHKDKAKLSVEYIVRGVDKQGNVFMTVLKEEKLHSVSKLDPHCVKMLYSAEVASDIRSMNVSLDTEFSIKNLRLEPQKREIVQRSSAPVQSQPLEVKKEQQSGKKNLFATVSKPPAPMKEEKSIPPSIPGIVKEEPQPPSATKVSPKKQSPKKDTKKVANAKGSISSFFSSKPGQTAGPKVASTTSAVKQESESPASSTSESTPSQKRSKSATKPEPEPPQVTARKRTITDDERSEEDQDVIPSTPKEEKSKTKKRSGKPTLKRKKTANPSKKSRIMEICDSSSDDDMDAGREEAEERKRERIVEFDEEMTEPPVVGKQKTPSPEKPVENDSNTANRNRGKVKKMITKTFTDDDGYLITVKDWEMVSEDESTVSEPVKGAKVSANQSAAKPKPTPGSQTKAGSGEKKESPPTPRTKQGSIMSFFAKK